jgi:hypothetical protein
MAERKKPYLSFKETEKMKKTLLSLVSVIVVLFAFASKADNWLCAPTP